jgi:hypothetical protein
MTGRESESTAPADAISVLSLLYAGAPLAVIGSALRALPPDSVTALGQVVSDVKALRKRRVRPGSAADWQFEPAKSGSCACLTMPGRWDLSAPLSVLQTFRRSALGTSSAIWPWTLSSLPLGHESGG